MGCPLFPVGRWEGRAWPYLGLPYWGWAWRPQWGRPACPSPVIFHLCPASRGHGLWAAAAAPGRGPPAAGRGAPGPGLPRALPLRRGLGGLRGAAADGGRAAQGLPGGHHGDHAPGQQPEQPARGALRRAAGPAPGAAGRQPLALRLRAALPARLARGAAGPPALPGPALRGAPAPPGPAAALPGPRGAAGRLRLGGLQPGAGRAARPPRPAAAARAAAAAAAAPALALPGAGQGGPALGAGAAAADPGPLTRAAPSASPGPVSRPALLGARAPLRGKGPGPPLHPFQASPGPTD